MTTNEIEKQLISKAHQQISEQAQKVVEDLAAFGREHTSINQSGMRWHSRPFKPIKRYNHSPEPEDPWNHFDWDELARLIRRNMGESFLKLMVEKKTKELLSKMDLFE